ncbi:helix-turn-helix domain-containing protein [Glaciimonas immobilis]|uniref:Transcriptional regulator with XRE-family HTH domain n=1 Tax=Glaciimonas immobilis TaxID=728004 RepID=A0A840RPB2_9BURK|nr:helix-turn-helix transcriptional regulator [Glaciimonas immobilis]KAF3999044.1 helix-turn-helix transcriptional regulator [Glaciimonas immobilis]MBB5198471.1 transcriptional regulator with XRE-family HTH domain [Glaciimonas immobilis]
MGIGLRLKEERERLGMSQTEFAALCDVGRKTQFNYESDERSPDANYLAAIAQSGADIGYIVTGRHSDAKIAQGTIVNWTLLEQVIVGVEEFLTERKAKLKPEKKAGLIRVLYAKFSDDKNLDQTRFNDFMDAVMTTV